MPLDPKKDNFPYATSTSPARQMTLVVKSDTNDLEIYAKALRVYNPGGGGQVLRVLPVGNPDGDTVDLTFPPGLVIELTAVRRVLSTGSDPSMIVHAISQ